MTTSLSTNCREVDEIQPFHTPASLFQDLQTVLAGLIEPDLQGKQAHWNLVGTNFRDLHLQLDSIDDLEKEAWLLKSENGKAQTIQGNSAGGMSGG